MIAKETNNKLAFSAILSFIEAEIREVYVSVRVC